MGSVRDGRYVIMKSQRLKTPTHHRSPVFILTRDAIFRKITNQNQTDTNEMVTTETKYQTDFYSVQKYQYLTKF